MTVPLPPLNISDASTLTSGAGDIKIDLSGITGGKITNESGGGSLGTIGLVVAALVIFTPYIKKIIGG